MLLKISNDFQGELMRLHSWPLPYALFVTIVMPGCLFAAEQRASEKVVANGSVVSLQYTLTGEDGKIIDSNKGKEPLKYTQGQKQIVPGLEKELAGMKVGGEKRVTVKPEDGYGPVNKQAFQEIPKESVPPEGLKVGAVLMAKGPQGEAIPVRVHEIKEKTVVMDLNHPLAGKTLIFDVKVVDIQSPPSNQLPTPPQPGKPSQQPESKQPAQPAPAK
jgi:FKBP-type peptidyl-prolyl cis-trans isomerase SlyD